MVSDRLRKLREDKNLSQGDIERRSGLLRCYISRVENGHTVPSVETLEKFARALEVPVYQFFYDGAEPPNVPNVWRGKSSAEVAWGGSGKHAAYLHTLRKYLSKARDADRKLILIMAQKLVSERSRRT